MLPFQSHYGFQGSWLNYRNGDHAKRSISAAGCSIVSDAADSSMNEKKSTEASLSHKEAERRRRQRINTHLSTLRTLLPNTTKTDKASLLAEVVSHVKELRRRATEVARRIADGDGGAVSCPFPSEEDEATLCYCDDENRVMRATVCCDERFGLNRELMQAIRSIHARVVRAETMTLGGRTKNVVVLEWSGGEGGGGREEEFMGLRRALKAIVENQAQSFSGHKRARACYPVGDQFFMC